MQNRNVGSLDVAASGASEYSRRRESIAGGLQALQRERELTATLWRDARDILLQAVSEAEQLLPTLPADALRNEPVAFVKLDVDDTRHTVTLHLRIFDRHLTVTLESDAIVHARSYEVSMSGDLDELPVPIWAHTEEPEIARFDEITGVVISDTTEGPRCSVVIPREHNAVLTIPLADMIDVIVQHCANAARMQRTKAEQHVCRGRLAKA